LDFSLLYKLFLLVFSFSLLLSVHFRFTSQACQLGVCHLGLSAIHSITIYKEPTEISLSGAENISKFSLRALSLMKAGGFLLRLEGGYMGNP